MDSNTTAPTVNTRAYHEHDNIIFCEDTKKKYGDMLTFCYGIFVDIIRKYASPGTDSIGVAFLGLLYTICVHGVVLMPSERLHHFINTTHLGQCLSAIIIVVIPLCWALIAYACLFVEESDLPASKRLAEGFFGAIMIIIVGMLAVLASHELSKRKQAYNRGLRSQLL